MDYEILLRGDKDGNLKGAHVLETPTSIARPVKEGDWPAIVTGINEAALAKAASAETEASALKAEAKAALDESAAAITALQSELAEAKATLAEHQTLTDQGMAAAGPLIDKVLAGTATDEDKATLAYIFGQFALYSSSRAAALKAKEKAELEEKKAALEAKLAAL